MSLPHRWAVVGSRELCRGCVCCEVICTLSHEQICRPSISRIRIRKDFFTLDFRPVTCMQCGKAPCMEACPVEGAMYIHSATGARMINEERCTGCGACAEACPFDVVRYYPEKRVYVKCDLCNGAPECVAYCPRNALRYVRFEVR